MLLLALENEEATPYPGYLSAWETERALVSCWPLFARHCVRCYPDPYCKPLQVSVLDHESFREVKSSL